MCMFHFSSSRIILTKLGGDTKMHIKCIHHVAFPFVSFHPSKEEYEQVEFDLRTLYDRYSIAESEEKKQEKFKKWHNSKW